jgi:hypothetical protein
MKKMFLILALIFGATTIASAQSPNTNRVEGVWQVLTIEGGKKIPADWNFKRIYTEGHFTAILTDGANVVFTMGGTYTFDGETLVENCEFSLDPNVGGITMVSKLTFDGSDSVSCVGGAEGGGQPRNNETWTRIK